MNEHKYSDSHLTHPTLETKQVGQKKYETYFFPTENMETLEYFTGTERAIIHRISCHILAHYGDQTSTEIFDKIPFAFPLSEDYHRIKSSLPCLSDRTDFQRKLNLLTRRITGNELIQYEKKTKMYSVYMKKPVTVVKEVFDPAQFQKYHQDKNQELTLFLYDNLLQKIGPTFKTRLVDRVTYRNSSSTQKRGSLLTKSTLTRWFSSVEKMDNHNGKLESGDGGRDLIGTNMVTLATICAAVGIHFRGEITSEIGSFHIDSNDLNQLPKMSIEETAYE